MRPLEEDMGEETRAGAAGTFRDAGFFLLALILWMAGMSVAASLLFGKGTDTRTLYLVSGGVELLLAVPAAVYMRLRRIRLSPLFGSARPRQIAAAAAAGLLLVPLSVAVAMVWNLLVLLTGGNIRSDSIPVPETAAQLLAAFAAVGLMAPAVEEPIMRGLLFNAGVGVLPRNKAILLVTAAFSLLHGNFLGLPSIFLGGLLLVILVWRSGSLWPAVAAHMTYNTAATALETLIHNAVPVPANAPAPQAMELLAAALFYVLLSLPFVALFGVAMWLFWRSAPQHPRPRPGVEKMPLSMSWPWLASFVLLLCYIAIDVLRVYGIIGVN